MPSFQWLMITVLLIQTGVLGCIVNYSHMRCSSDKNYFQVDAYYKRDKSLSLPVIWKIAYSETELPENLRESKYVHFTDQKINGSSEFNYLATVHINQELMQNHSYVEIIFQYKNNTMNVYTRKKDTFTEPSNLGVRDSEALPSFLIYAIPVGVVFVLMSVFIIILVCKIKKERTEPDLRKSKQGKQNRNRPISAKRRSTHIYDDPQSINQNYQGLDSKISFAHGYIHPTEKMEVSLSHGQWGEHAKQTSYQDPSEGQSSHKMFSNTTYFEAEITKKKKLPQRIFVKPKNKDNQEDKQPITPKSPKSFMPLLDEPNLLNNAISSRVLNNNEKDGMVPSISSQLSAKPLYDNFSSMPATENFKLKPRLTCS